MDAKTKKIAIYIFACIVGFGLGLTFVSLFLSVVDVRTNMPVQGTTSGTMNASLSLFDADWDSMDASPAFLIISFVVAIIGMAMLSVDISMRSKLKKKIKGLNFAAAAVTLIGAVLLIVASVVTLNSVEDSMTKIMLAVAKQQAEAMGGEVDDKTLMMALKTLVSFKLGAGAIMGIIGSVIAALGGLLLLLPAFDPTKDGKAPAAAAPAATVATPIAQNDNIAVQNDANANQAPAADGNACECGMVNSPDADYCLRCGRKLK